MEKRKCAHLRQKKPARRSAAASNKKALQNEGLKKLILKNGKDILDSAEFREAFSEPHHFLSNVSDHSLSVCIIAVRICRFLKKHGIDVNVKDVIRASLCHDFGMRGRHTRYKSHYDTWQNHARESAADAKRLFPGFNEKTDAMIQSHMWPFAGPRPRSREAVVLNLADKLASGTDWFSYLTGRLPGGDIRRELTGGQSPVTPRDPSPEKHPD